VVGSGKKREFSANMVKHMRETPSVGIGSVAAHRRPPTARTSGRGSHPARRVRNRPEQVIDSVLNARRKLVMYKRLEYAKVPWRPIVARCAATLARLPSRRRETIPQRAGERLSRP
jgi:hypothetical protein